MKLLTSLLFASAATVVTAQGTWTPITNPFPTNGACMGLLLTDGTVMVQSNSNGSATNHWYKLTPDNTGSYVNGTWTQLADSRSDYGPLFYASAVLADGRVYVVGGEYNELDGSDSSFTRRGAIYNPVTNAWANLDGPSAFSGGVGDAECAILPNGKFMLAYPLSTLTATLDPTTLVWTSQSATGKTDAFDEEGWTLLPDGTILTLDVQNTPQAEKYVIANNNWVTASATAVAFTDPPNYGYEMGPAVLRYDGQVVQIGANNHTALYTPPGTPTDPGTWTAGPDIPNSNGGADAPACILPNGNVLFAVSPLPIFNGTPTTYYEFTTGNTLLAVPSPPNAPFENCFTETMLMLPTGQVMLFDTTTGIQFYNPTGSPNNAWRPTVTSVASTLVAGQDYTISGTQFNGLSNGSVYGDDWSNATNYPIVRITINSNSHVYYCRTHDHSTMAVGTGGTTVSTHFTVPATIESGAATLQVVTNGIPSTGTAVTAVAQYTQSVSTSPTQCPGGNTVTGTVTLNTAAPLGGITVNLSSDQPNAVVPATVTVLQGNTTATFSITTSNNTYTSVNATITESYAAEPNHTCILKVQPNNRSTFYGQTAPTTMVCGQSYPVSFLFKNTGSVTWDTAHTYQIGSANPYNNSNFGMNRIPLTSGAVAPAATGTFSATVIGPSTPGTYNFQWQMYMQSENMFFGQASSPISVVVTAKADAARYISRSGPTTVAAGASFFAQNTFMNVGTNSWSTATGYSMMIINPNNNTIWTTTRGYLSSGTIAPGSNGTFTGSCTAPTSPGVYTMQWQMDKNGVPFGDTSPLLNITVTGSSADNATFVSETQVPTSVAVGVTFGVTFTMHNSGSTTWSGPYALASTGSNNFGVASIAPTGTVTSGNDGTFTTTFTAPASPGTYTFQQRMTNGTTQFGVPTPGLSITVTSADAAEYISRTGTLTIAAGKDFFIQNTMKNTGTTSWSTATGYSMMTVNPNNDPTWTATRAYLASGTIAPGSSGTFNANCTAPIIAGAYFMQWQMDKSNVPFGETTPLLVIFVYQGADDAQFISQSGIPTSCIHGTTFTPTITMKNVGTGAWTTSYSLVSIGSNNFGVASIPSTAVGVNGTKAFSTTFTAPNTPGTYTFKMRMQNASAVKFGQTSTVVTITVT